MKKILFITGTRADYGKIKSLVRKVDQSPNFEAFIYVSGMHLLDVLGNTYEEVLKDGYKNIQIAYDQANTKIASYDLGNVICSLTGYVRKIQPDMIVIHGDRIDALAGAVVGALNNICVAHIEGGEISGTIDESIRHAISKFAHIHFVSNEDARNRLIQLGECLENIFVIGSPDIDLMLSNNLPSIEDVRIRYEIPFNTYGILMYHPVTTEFEQLGKNIENVVDSIIGSKENYVVIYPNNDLGYELILEEYKRLSDEKRFKIFPSLRFEYFLTLLKNSKFIIGNSSAGIREAAIYGIPAIDIGSRQNGRYSIERSPNIQHCSDDISEVSEALRKVNSHRIISKTFGDGNSTQRFYDIICDEKIWKMKLQKRFHELTWGMA